MSSDPGQALEAFTEDALLGGKVKFRQPRHGYRVAIDPVLLAAAVAAAPEQRILDAGAGVGAASLCLARRVPGVIIDGIELQPDLVDLAGQNAALNDLGDRVTFRVGDISRPPPEMAPNSYHHVMANPPFLERGRVVPSRDSGKERANVESGARLADWIEFCAARAVDGGGLTFIHRADRLAGLLAALEPVAGGIVICPLWPKAGVAAKRVIVSARKGVSKPLQLKPGLILHQRDGAYTAEAETLLRHGAALAI